MSIIDGISNDHLIQITIPEYIMTSVEEMQLVFLKNEFNASIEEAHENMRILRKRACDLIQLPLPDDFLKITHKIWLTYMNNPYQPNEETCRLVKQQYLNLPNHRHFFWSNNPRFCKEFIDKFNINSIEVRDISEFIDYPGYRVYKAYLNQKLFANACDIVRLQVVCKYGGIYSDMGFSFKSTIQPIIKNFNIIINGEFVVPGIVSHNILGSKTPEHYLYKTILQKIDNIELNKLYYKSRNNISGIIELSSPRMLTAAVSTICKNDSILLIVNNDYTCDRYHNHSWFGDGKYGCLMHENIDYCKFENDLNI